MLLQLVVLSISLSIDAFGIGISFELKGVKMGMLSRCIIGMMSSVIMYVALLFGNACMLFFPDVIMKIFGISVLCLIGITFIKDSLFGEPAGMYDRNQSKNIEWAEAVILGAALSADAFSAGFAFVALNMSSWLIPVTVGMMQVAFLYLGGMLAQKGCFARKMNSKCCSAFSGILLIVIALIKGFSN